LGGAPSSSAAAAAGAGAGARAADADSAAYATHAKPRRSATTNLSAIAEAVEACQETHRARAELLRLRELEGLAPLAAPAVLARRGAALGSASAALSRVSRERVAVARRLREARVRPGIAVDPARQPDLSALLRHAAGGAAILEHGGRLLRGAVGEGGGEQQARGPGGAAGGSKAAAAAAERWEEALRPVQEAAVACKERVDALEAFSRAMMAREEEEDERGEEARVAGAARGE
jgi:hypothetical protein